MWWVFTPWPNLVWASTEKLFVTTISYFQGRSTISGTYTCEGYFEFLTFILETLTFTLKLVFGPLLRNHFLKIKSSSLLSTEIVYANHLIFSAHINITCDLCTVASFGPFDRRPWNDDLHYENLLWAIARKLYMAIASYFQCKSILLWHLPWKVCLGHWSGAINGYILWAYQPNMGPVHCKVILTFWPLTLILWPWNWKSCLVHCSAC